MTDLSWKDKFPPTHKLKCDRYLFSIFDFWFNKNSICVIFILPYKGGGEKQGKNMSFDPDILFFGGKFDWKDKSYKKEVFSYNLWD